MQISIFLAKFFAVYFVIIGLYSLVNPQNLFHRAKAYMNNEAVMLLGGVFTLLLGILLILLHSFWVNNWSLVITILAWVTFIKGLIHVLCPKLAIQWLEKMSSPLAYRISGVVCMLLALYLGYHGFDFSLHY